MKLPARLQTICEMVPRGAIIVDVGTDHGHVARRRGAVGSEREFHRLPSRTDIPRVVADGLRGFRSVDVAIITGMGPRPILKILSAGPFPTQAVVHAPQGSHVLRRGLAEQGWRIEEERLAPENDAFAEVIRIRRGTETHSGHTLEFGPFLPHDPLCRPHAALRIQAWQTLAQQAPPNTEAHQRAVAWVDWLEELLERLPPMGSTH
ncbi:MAG: tRNA (adenine(22)-N(1))-methyltransferase TrmK [Myxococcota bacterium]|nr:tRNA (adenine(22)-N(1))-methyltransferase TrmK [Myxococcota bacterium]